MSEWIKCKDRMPTVQQGYLVYWIRTEVFWERVTDNGDTITSRKKIEHWPEIKLAWFNGKNFNESGVRIEGLEVDVVTHWMALPPPPTEGEK